MIDFTHYDNLGWSNMQIAQELNIPVREVEKARHEEKKIYKNYDVWFANGKKRSYKGVRVKERCGGLYVFEFSSGKELLLVEHNVNAIEEV